MATFMAVVLKGDIHLKQDKTTNIKIRIIHNQKVDYISTDLYVNPNNFEKGFASGKNSSFLNSRIRDEINICNERYLKIGSIVNKLTIKELKQRLMGEGGNVDIDFHDFAEKYVEELKKQNRIGTARGLNGVISNLKKFRSSLKFTDIDLQFLNEFVSYLKSNGVKNAVDNYMRGFRGIFNAGREKYNDEDRGILRIPHYPFRKFKFEKIKLKTHEYRLTVDQLKLFINYQGTRDREQMAKDMFLLMFYLIGINTADLFNIGKPDKAGRVNYTRAKTGREYSIKLEPEAKEIIARYKGKDRLINLSEWYGNHLDWLKYINIELKNIGKAILKKLQENDPEADYPLEMSTNWARHTWATIARNDCRINKDDVALCLGHEDSDNKVTDIYINYDYSIIDESNRKVLDMLK
jgi:integrase